MQSEQHAYPLHLTWVAHCFCASAGKYKLSKQQVEFSKYMEDEGYHIIKISAKHQLVSLYLQSSCIRLGTDWQLGTLLQQTVWGTFLCTSTPCLGAAVLYVLPFG